MFCGVLAHKRSASQWFSVNSNYLWITDGFFTKLRKCAKVGKFVVILAQKDRDATTILGTLLTLEHSLIF